MIIEDIEENNELDDNGNLIQDLIFYFNEYKDQQISYDTINSNIDNNIVELDEKCKMKKYKTEHLFL